MKKFSLIVVMAGALTACGGGSSSSGHKAVDVSYSVDPATGPTCNNTSDISTFRGSYFTSVDCTWQCSTYKEQTNVYVSLDFRRRNQPGATWALDHEYVSGGICG